MTCHTAFVPSFISFEWMALSLKKTILSVCRRALPKRKKERKEDRKRWDIPSMNSCVCLSARHILKQPYIHTSTETFLGIDWLIVDGPDQSWWTWCDFGCGCICTSILLYGYSTLRFLTGNWLGWDSLLLFSLRKRPCARVYIQHRGEHQWK